MIIHVQYSHRMLMGTLLGFGMLAIVTLALSIKQWHSDWIFVHQASSLPSLTKTANAESLMASIPENQLFGKSEGQLPVTNLQMTVTGIVKVSDQSGLVSKAYLSIDGQPSKIYKMGDDLPNGVKINSISQDAVILENDGRFEKLPLPREKLQFKPKSVKEHY
jgi:type II secretory pathway component PulC